jgi:predicted GH43/DUF377 family glycosyl hydrolase
MDSDKPALIWRSLGQVFGPQMGPSWMKTHAQVPTPLLDEDAGVIRIYFSARPENGISLTSYVDLDAENPLRVVHVNQAPLLELGKPGSFDEHGIMPSCAVRHDNLVYLYYSGWSRSTTVPYTNSTGLAISADGGHTFRRAGEGPVLAKSLGDPYSATSPFVLHQNGLWRMWYCSGTGWPQVDGKYEHVYDIKEALSDDGVYWRPTGQVVLSATPAEEALTRPWVMQIGSKWRLWYCHRQARDFRDGGGAYRIASAASADLLSWARLGPDGPQPNPDASAWDALALAYPALIKVGSKLLMFYNGNGFGAGGFGVASAELERVGRNDD